MTRFIGFWILLALAVGMGSLWICDLDSFTCKFIAHEHFNTKEGLKTIKLSSNDFADIQNKDEVRINGSLYDVYGYAVTGDSVTLTVWHDDEEETLQIKIVSLVEGQQQISHGSGYNHFGKYHPYIPDFKIMPEKNALFCCILQLDANNYARPGSFNLLQFSPTDIIKPPCICCC